MERLFAREIHDDVCANGYDAELGSFVQSYGSKWLDGSLLLLPTTGFLPPDDPRVLGTIRAIEGRLIQDGLVMRHDPAEIETGLAHGEGAFLACSFWLADAYTLTGREREVRTMIAMGRGTSWIAAELGISSSTVETHVRHCLEKLGARNRAHAIARGLQTAEISVELDAAAPQYWG